MRVSWRRGAAAATVVAACAAVVAVVVVHGNHTRAGHPVMVGLGTASAAAAATASTSSSSLPPNSTTTATAPVTVADGGTAALPDGTRVVIPAGSVSENTTLTVTRAGTPPAPVAGAVPAGSAVHIELAAGTLTGPAQLTLPAAAPPGWPAGLSFTPLLAYYDDASGAWTAQQADWDASTATLTAQVDHFSWWNPFTWDYRAIGDAIKQALADLAGVPSGIAPTCQSPVLASRMTVRAQGAELLDYCLDQAGTSALLRTGARPDFPLLLSWSGSAQLRSRPEFGLDLSSVYRWLASQQGLDPADTVVVPTGGTVDLTVAPDSNAAVPVDASYDPSLQLIGVVDATTRVILALRSALGISTKAEDIAADVMDTSCFVQHIDDFGTDPAGTFTTMLLDCVKDGVQAVTRGAGGLVRIIGWGVGVIGSLIGVVANAANQVVSLFYAGKAVLTGNADERLVVAAPNSPTAAPTGPAATPWPVRDNEGPPVLYAWFGASFEIPDWVSCSYGGAWCIAGIGDAVHIMRLHGLADVGSVPLASRDPVAALLAKGLARNVATQLVRSGCPPADTCS